MTLARVQAASIKRAVPDVEAATSHAAQATTDPCCTLQYGIAAILKLIDTLQAQVIAASLLVDVPAKARALPTF